MKINSINQNNSFTSRNATVRKADDIVRFVRHEFPIVSRTHTDTFWLSAKPKFECTKEELTQQLLDEFPQLELPKRLKA